VPIAIRDEQAGDIAAIQALNERVFGRTQEARHVDALRSEFRGHNTNFLLTAGSRLDEVSSMGVYPAGGSRLSQHVTQRGVRSIPIFDDDGGRKACLDFMAEELNRFSVEVLAKVAS
jgi:hypothetical protein